MPSNYVCSAAAGCNQTFTKFVDLKKHEARHAPYAYICTWPGCDFATLMKASLDIHFDKHTGEQRRACPHDDCDYKTHNPALLTCHRKKCHGYIPLRRGRGALSATGSGVTQWSSQPPAQPQPPGFFPQFAPAPMQPQPVPPQPMQSHPPQYQPHPTQYQTHPTPSQPPPPIYSQLSGVPYGPADTADDYTMDTAPGKASHGWTEGCVCPELMQRRPSEMPGYEYKRC